MPLLLVEEAEEAEEKTSRCTTEHFDCTCYAAEHSLRLTFDPDENIICADVFLNTPRIFKRFWIALKYIFGCDGAGQWNTFELDSLDVHRMRQLLRQVDLP